jgi:hypothetical protein
MAQAVGARIALASPMRTKLFAVAISFFSFPVACAGTAKRTEGGQAEQIDGGKFGMCGRVCAPITLASGQSSLYSLALDEGNAYWTNAAPISDGVPSGGNVMGVPLVPGQPWTISTVDPLPISIAVDGARVYWRDGFDLGLYAAPLAGGVPIRLVSLVSTESQLAVAGTNVYFADYDGNNGSFLASVPVTGGSTTKLASALTTVGNIAVRDGNVYWTDIDQVERVTRLMKVSTGGGAAMVLYSGHASYDQGWGGIAVDATTVYWTNTPDAGSQVMRTPIAGGATTSTPAGLLGGDIAVDVTNVYWTERAPDGTNEDSVMKAPLAGGAATEAASNQGVVRALAANSHAVCWLNETAGTVVRLGACLGGTCD